MGWVGMADVGLRLCEAWLESPDSARCGFLQFAFLSTMIGRCVGGDPCTVTDTTVSGPVRRLPQTQQKRCRAASARLPAKGLAETVGDKGKHGQKRLEEYCEGARGGVEARVCAG